MHVCLNHLTCLHSWTLLFSMEYFNEVLWSKGNWHTYYLASLEIVWQLFLPGAMIWCLLALADRCFLALALRWWAPIFIFSTDCQCYWFSLFSLASQVPDTQGAMLNIQGQIYKKRAQRGAVSHFAAPHCVRFEATYLQQYVASLCFPIHWCTNCCHAPAQTPLHHGARMPASCGDCFCAGRGTFLHKNNPLRHVSLSAQQKVEKTRRNKHISPNYVSPGDV